MSGQTQPETALQALAEKLRTDAIAIFGEGQAERDIIEWFYGALLAAAPAKPAAQDGTTSDRYRAELYDEVWQKARDMGYGNVTEALLALERSKAAAHDQGEVQRLRVPANFYRELEALRELNQAALHYHDNYMLDEVESVENCVDRRHHEAAVSLHECLERAALAASTGQEVGK